jgi:hypothetical protein
MTADDRTVAPGATSPPLVVPDEVYALGGAGVETALDVFGEDWVLAECVRSGRTVDVHCVDTARGDREGTGGGPDEDLASRIDRLDARGEEVASLVRDRVDDPDAVGGLSATFDSVTAHAGVESARDLLGAAAEADEPPDGDEDGAGQGEGGDWLSASLGATLAPGADLRAGTGRRRALGKALHYLALAESPAYRRVFDVDPPRDGEPRRVAVVTSLGGGTGGALAIDVARRVREQEPRPEVTLFATVPSTREPDPEKANAFAALSELEYAALADDESSPFTNVVVVPMEPTGVGSDDSVGASRGELTTALAYATVGYYNRDGAAAGALTGTTPYAPFTTAVPQVVQYGGAAVAGATDAAQRALGATCRTVNARLGTLDDLEWFLAEVVGRDAAAPTDGAEDPPGDDTEGDAEADPGATAPIVDHADDEAALRSDLAMVADWLDHPALELLEGAERDEAAGDPLAPLREPFATAAHEANLDADVATGDDSATAGSSFGDPFGGATAEADEPVSAGRVLEAAPIGTVLDAVDAYVEDVPDPIAGAAAGPIGDADGDGTTDDDGSPGDSAPDADGGTDGAAAGVSDGPLPDDPDLDVATVRGALDAALRTVAHRRELGERARAVSSALDGPVAEAVEVLLAASPDPERVPAVRTALADERAAAAEAATERAGRVTDLEARLGARAAEAAAEWRGAVAEQLRTAATLARADLEGALDRVTEELETFAASLAAGPADEADSEPTFAALNALEAEVDGRVSVDPDREDIERAMAGLREARRIWSDVANAEGGLLGRLRRTGGKRAAYADVRADVEETGVFSVPPLPDSVGDAGFAPVVTYSPRADGRLLERAERARDRAVDEAVAAFDDRLVSAAGDGGAEESATGGPDAPVSEEGHPQETPTGGERGTGTGERDGTPDPDGEGAGAGPDPGPDATTGSTTDGPPAPEAAYETPGTALAAVREAVESLRPADGDGDLLETAERALAAQGATLGALRTDLRGARRALAAAERRRERAAAAADLLEAGAARVETLATDGPAVDEALATAREQLARIADVDGGRLDGSYVHATLPETGRLTALDGDSLAAAAPFGADERGRLHELLRRVVRERVLDREYNGLRRNSLSAPFDGGTFRDTRVGVATLSRGVDPTGASADLFGPADLDVGDPIRRHFSLDADDAGGTDEGETHAPTDPDRWWLSNAAPWDVGLCAYVQGLGFLDNLREVDGFESHYRAAYERATAGGPAATIVRHSFGLMRGFLVRRADVRNVDANPGKFVGRNPERLRREQLDRLERVELDDLGE